MILADTSIWIAHLRRADAALAEILAEGAVLMHPYVIGELACGNLRNRQEILDLLGDLPSAPVATDEEALTFIEQKRLMGRGVGYIDVHLLAAAALADGARLWTTDAPLRAVAARLLLSWEPKG